MKQKRIYKKKDINFKVQRWTVIECGLYQQFIMVSFGLSSKDNLDIYVDSRRKRKKNFIQMSQFIGTKTACQCRSHHQKLFSKTIHKLNNHNINQTIQSEIVESGEFESSIMVHSGRIDDNLMNYNSKCRENIEIQTIFSMNSQQQPDFMRFDNQQR